MVGGSEVCIFPEPRRFDSARPRHPTMPTAPASSSTCTVRLEEVRGSANTGGSGSFLVSVPGTEYVLDLVSGGATAVPLGKRVTGSVSGRAQKLHRAHAGGSKAFEAESCAEQQRALAEHPVRFVDEQLRQPQR